MPFDRASLGSTWSLVLCSLHNSTDATTTASLSTTSDSSGCPTCSTIKKSGKLSCCARGGAWFKNCGDVGDTTFDHTWAEGIQACKGFVSSRLADPSLRVIPSHPQNASQRQTNRYRAVSMANAGVQDCAECFGSPKIIVFICVLFILLHLQMLFHFS